MIIPRVIPILLLRGDGLVKGARFRDHKYVGDPMNAIKIYSEREADELILLDILASAQRRTLNLAMIERVAKEAYMPFAVGGGFNKLEDVREVLLAGAEKVCLNTAAVEQPDLISRAADTFGSQSVLVSIDYKADWRGKLWVHTYEGQKKTNLEPLAWAQEAARRGAGEILLTSIDRDGVGSGYDLAFIAKVAKSLTVPLIACGGAGEADHLGQAWEAGAAAAAAGSIFVFHGRKRAVLISYPDQEELDVLRRRSSCK